MLVAELLTTSPDLREAVLECVEAKALEYKSRYT